MAALNGSFAGYCDPFCCQAPPSTRELGRQGHPELIKDCIDFIGKHREQNELRKTLSEEAELHLKTVEALSLDALATHLQDVELMCFHWALKRAVDEEFDNHYNKPELGTVYMLWDHMVPH